MSNRNDEYADARPSRGLFGVSTSWIFFGVGLLLILGVLGFAGNWLGFGASKLSPQNVESQYTFAYTYQESLDATARQVCTAERAVAAATPGSEEATQRRTQQIAQENNYSRIEAEYNAKLRNAFQAKYIKPSDVPDIAPTLAQTKAKVCTP